MGDERAVEPLILLLGDQVPDVVCVIRALTLRDPRAFEPLIRCIDSPTGGPAREPAWALGELW